MNSQGRKRRVFSASLAMIVWLCLGLMLPIIASLYSSNHALHDAVVAAPRDSYAIFRPVAFPAIPNVQVERGTLIVVDATGKPTTLVSSGGTPTPSASSLLLENGVVSVSRTAVDQNAGKDLVDVVAPLVAALAASRFETLFLRRTTIVLKLTDQIAEPMSDVQADVSLKRKGLVTIKGSGILRGQHVSFDIAAGNPAADRAGSGLRIPIKLHVKAPLGEAQFDGRMATAEGLDLAGQGEISLKSVRQIARWLGALWSSGPGLRDASVRGQVALTGPTLSVEQAQIRMDENEATGALAVTFAGARPQVSGTLAYKSFDAMRYLAGGPAEQREFVNLSSIASRLLTAPLGMILDADLRVSADRVLLGSVEFGRSAATVALKDGRLLADLAELRFNGGEGSGQVGADFTGFHPKLTIRGKLENVDLGRVSKAVSDHVVVQAPATLIADLWATGATPEEVIASLTGKISVRSSEGGRLGIDLRQILTAGPNAVTYGWGNALRGRTSFDVLDLKLVVRDGVVLTEAAEMTSADAVWNATGLVNLVSERVDVRLAHASPPSPQARASGVPRPGIIELRGPWSVPQVKTLVDPAGADAPSVAAGRPPSSP